MLVSLALVPRNINKAIKNKRNEENNKITKNLKKGKPVHCACSDALRNSNTSCVLYIYQMLVSDFLSSLTVPVRNFVGATGLGE